MVQTNSFSGQESADLTSYLNFRFSAEADLHKQLATMPIRTDTLRVRTRRETLERKIGEVEEAIKIFSRPKVFVKLDS